jgi:undecaprenyl-diphosphatase
MELWQAIILGLVEGITEYLPVSSTGHLIITGELLGLKSLESRAAMNAFDVVIQGGAILAVAGLYFPRFVQMLKGLIGRDRAGLKLLMNLLIAFMPAAVLGFLLHDAIEARLFSTWPVVGALVVGGVYMIVVDRWHRRRAREWAVNKAEDTSPGRAELEIDELTPAKALLIGVMQCVAMWPGVSRSMMTITGGLFAGLKPAAAAEFSFLLGMPTLLAASCYALLKNLLHARKTGEPNLFEAIGIGPCVIGMLVAAVSAAIAVKWLVGFLNRHGLAPFGYYRIVLAIVLIGLASAGLVRVAPV